LPSAASQNSAEAVRIERFDPNRHDVAAEHACVVLSKTLS
jgi:hypothetical protein